MHNTKMVQSLNHWALFESLCTLCLVVYLFDVLSDFTSGGEVLLGTALMLIVRTVLLFILWYSTSPTAKLKADTIKSRITYD